MEEVAALVECPICGELKTDFRVLPSCGHSFCLEDLNAIVGAQNMGYRCPICRLRFECPQGDPQLLIKDWTRIALAELVLNWQHKKKQSGIQSRQPSTDASEKEHYGTTFQLAHSTEIQEMSEVLQAWVTKEKDAICPQHNRTTAFCMTCKITVCVNCTHAEHKGHRVCFPNDRFKKEILPPLLKSTSIFIRAVKLSTSTRKT